MRKEVLPLLQSRAAHLKRIFATIDKYQELIDATKKSVTDMEARVEASQEATATISVQKIFSFFSVRSTNRHSFIGREALSPKGDRFPVAEETRGTRCTFAQECEHCEYDRVVRASP